jgi:hypothetical protein
VRFIRKYKSRRPPEFANASLRTQIAISHNIDSPMTNELIQQRLSDFKTDLATGEFDEVFHKHFLASRSPVLQPKQERDIVFEVSRSFETPVTNVFLVGSAKLGFRMLPKDADSNQEIPARLQFSEFDDYSDIDVAIVSTELFLSFWKRARDYHAQSGYPNYRRWDATTAALPFAYYLVQGWIRPDALPASLGYDLRGEWFAKVDKVNSLRIADAKVKVGLFFDPQFLTYYQVNALKKCMKLSEAKP